MKPALLFLIWVHRAGSTLPSVMEKLATLTHLRVKVPSL